MNFYDEIFMLLYVFFFIEKYDITLYNFFFICFIFKNMFFKIPRNDGLNITSFLKKLLDESSENLSINQSDYEFDAKSQTNKGYEWKLYFKTKVSNILALNIFISIIYIFFYLLKGFSLVKIYYTNFLVIILFALNGIIEQLALFVKTVENCIKDSNQILIDILIGLGGSIIAFILMFWMTSNMAGVTLVIYLTYYFLFFRLYSFGKNYDIMIINFNRYVKNNNEKKDEDNYDERSSNSFNRLITKDIE